ncbi:hypothetical protein K0M31_012991, partial [Melipona bicolor]
DIDDAHLDNPELYSGINQRYRCITKQLRFGFFPLFPLEKQYSRDITIVSRLCARMHWTVALQQRIFRLTRAYFDTLVDEATEHRQRGRLRTIQDTACRAVAVAWKRRSIIRRPFERATCLSISGIFNRWPRTVRVLDRACPVSPWDNLVSRAPPLPGHVVRPTGNSGLTILHLMRNLPG